MATFNWAGLMKLLDEIQDRLTKVEARLDKLEKKPKKRKPVETKKEG